MLRPDAPGCCPVPTHPPLPDIRSGLSIVPRQPASFPEYRRALLAAIRSIDALAGWTRGQRGRSRGDAARGLGLCPRRHWPSTIAHRRAGLSARPPTTAPGCAKSCSLLGYEPRPALVARVQLALEACGRRQGQSRRPAPASAARRSTTSRRRSSSSPRRPKSGRSAIAGPWPRAGRTPSTACCASARQRSEHRARSSRSPSGGSRFVGRVSAVDSGDPRPTASNISAVHFEEGDPAAPRPDCRCRAMKSWILTTRVAPSPAACRPPPRWPATMATITWSSTRSTRRSPPATVAVERGGSLHVKHRRGDLSLRSSAPDGRGRQDGQHPADQDRLSERRPGPGPRPRSCFTSFRASSAGRLGSPGPASPSTT